MKIVLTIKQSIRHECVQVGVKVEIFAECVDRHHDGWNTVMRSCANTAYVGERVTQNVPHALTRDAAELLEQTAAKSKTRPSLFGIVKVKCRCATAATIESASMAPNTCTFSGGMAGRTNDRCRKLLEGIHGCTRRSAHEQILWRSRRSP